MANDRNNRLEAAAKAVGGQKLSLREASERYSIPKSTIYDHISGSRRCGAGRPTVLTELEEKSIVRSCQELAEIGFGVDRFLVGKVIHDYLIAQARETPFKDGVPGRKWWTGFLHRWPSLSERKPQHFPANRAQASTPDVMDHYFQNLKVKNFGVHKLGIYIFTNK